MPARSSRGDGGAPGETPGTRRPPPAGGTKHHSFLEDTTTQDRETYRGNSERTHPFRGGVNRVRLVPPTAGFRPLGVVLDGNSIAETNPETLGSFPPRRTARCSQYPCPCNTGWGDGTTNPTPPACEPVHLGSKDRQADGTARVRSPSNGGWSPGAVSGAVRADTASLPGRATCHTLQRAEVPSTNRSTPAGWKLASVGRPGPTHRFVGCDGRPDPERGEPHDFRWEDVSGVASVPSTRLRTRMGLFSHRGESIPMI